MADAPPLPKYDFAAFLATVPPNTFVSISGLVNERGYDRLEFPSVILFCDSKECGGDRNHDTEGGKISISLGQGFGGSGERFVDYKCRHCGQENKSFAVRAWLKRGSAEATVVKFGELPAFGPHTPARVVRLLGTDKELYFKGRRAESQGLGIAAFAYYRRVVENQKNALIDEIIRVAKHLGKEAEFGTTLENAKKEISFEKSVESIKGGIPPSLLLKGGHNPLTLLHTALSEGLHNDDDAECLELAGHIRAVLVDFSERIQSAMKEDAALAAAVTRLLQKKQKRPPTIAEEKSPDEPRASS